MSKLIMMRHGQSKWNELNLFTGWVDIPLSKQGLQEALEGAQRIKDIPIDVIFVSSLIRSQMTAMLVMSQHNSDKVPVFMHPGGGRLEEWSKIYSKETEAKCIPVYIAWELNERMYGALQGLNKAETAQQYGADQVKIWRRSYDVAPPEGESLENTAARTLPYFKSVIVPYLNRGKNVFISAHGNSLRSIIMFLDNLNKTEVVNLELGTGVPIVYDCDNSRFSKVQL